MDVAVGGCGLGGGAFAGRVAVLVGGNGVCVGEGTGCVSVGAAEVVGVGGLSVAGATVGEADGDGLGVALGWSMGVGCGVLVARAGTSRVLVGVAGIPGLSGAHRSSSNPSKPVPTRKSQNHRCLFIAECRVLRSFPPSFRPTNYTRELYRRQAVCEDKGSLCPVSVRRAAFTGSACNFPQRQASSDRRLRPVTLHCA